MAKVGAIAHLLLHDLPEDDTDRQQTLLERALVYAAESEQRMADQTERIAQLENLSFNDPLTGLLNRRGFRNHMEKVLASERRRGLGCGQPPHSDDGGDPTRRRLRECGRLRRRRGLDCRDAGKGRGHEIIG